MRYFDDFMPPIDVKIRDGKHCCFTDITSIEDDIRKMGIFAGTTMDSAVEMGCVPQLIWHFSGEINDINIITGFWACAEQLQLFIIIYLIYTYLPYFIPITLWLFNSHGIIDGPNRNRWFTELKN